MPNVVAEAIAREIVEQTWRHARRFARFQQAQVYQFAV
jgi:hypothetical protein